MPTATDIKPNSRYAEALVEQFSRDMEMSFQNAIRFLSKRQDLRAVLDLLGCVTEDGFARYPSDKDLAGLQECFLQHGYQLPPRASFYSGSVSHYVQR